MPKRKGDPMARLDNSQEAISDINVVPLVDVVLVVLIIFMVTAPMIMKSSVKVTLPKAVSGDKTIPTHLSIVMAADGKVLLNGQISTDEDIAAKSREEFQKNPEVQAIISADKNVPHGRVMAIIDFIKVAGIKKFAFSVDKKTAQ